MLPFILTVVGGYFIGSALTDKEEFAKGGQIGDSARVIAINKSGVIMGKQGKKYKLRFVDGSEGLYEADELEFTKQYAVGGSTVFFAEDVDGTEGVYEIEVEVEKMNKNELVLEVELKINDGFKNKYYFEYEIDKDSHSLLNIYDEEKKPLPKEYKKSLESDEELDKILEYTIDEALEDYHESKYESDDEPEEYEYAKGGKVKMSRNKFIKKADGGEIVKIKDNTDEDSEHLFMITKEDEGMVECMVIGENWKDWDFKPVIMIEKSDLEVIIPKS